MDANYRLQTTTGICLANSNVSGNHVLVVDLKGSQRRKRGKDALCFETQTSLFVLGISNVLLINIWAKDVCSCNCLLKRVFQVGAYAFLAQGRNKIRKFYPGRFAVRSVRMQCPGIPLRNHGFTMKWSVVFNNAKHASLNK